MYNIQVIQISFSDIHVQVGWLWSIIFDQHRNKKSGSKKFKQQRWTLSMYKKTEKSDEKEARTKKNRVALQAARQPFGRSINVSQENVRRTERYVSSSNFVPRRLQHIGAVAVATLSLEGCGCSFSAGFPAGG